ncbi:MAG: hypothetical protein JWN70_3472 [Planctomycetaceae bacterium]|nr:hypothetical protein [Planctomycetaceae bacterium]
MTKPGCRKNDQCSNNEKAIRTLSQDSFSFGHLGIGHSFVIRKFVIRHSLNTCSDDCLGKRSVIRFCLRDDKNRARNVRHNCPLLKNFLPRGSRHDV